MRPAICVVVTAVCLAPSSLSGQELRPQSVVVAGFRQHFVISEGQPRAPSDPAIILLAGSGLDSRLWESVQPRFAADLQSTVVSFDRAGWGQSELPDDPYALSDEVADLRQGLLAISVPPPYVLVGHSYGGLEAHMFAAMWPGEVSGIVFLDTNSPAAFIAPIGEFPDPIPQPDPQTPQERAFARWDEAGWGFFYEAYQNPLPRDLPIVVFSAERGPLDPHQNESLVLSHQLLARAVEDGEWSMLEGTTHNSIVNEVDAIVDAIRKMLGG